MSVAEARRIASADHPWLKRVRRLQRDPAAYRREGVAWLEGEHLLAAARARGTALTAVLVSASAWQREPLRRLAEQAAQAAIVEDARFAACSALQPAVAIGALVALPAPGELRADVDTVVLDRLQDAGNVGSVLRSAAALGARQVIALPGTAALWSPKVLRAGMGAHFALQLHESVPQAALQALRQPWIATGSHGGSPLHATRLPRPCAWVFGHEGRGVDAALARRCALRVRIEQPGGEESLNVAAAAAICLYEAARQRAVQ